MCETSKYGIVFDRSLKIFEVGYWDDIKGATEYSSSLHFYVRNSKNDDVDEDADEDASLKKMLLIFVELVAYHGFDAKCLHNEFMCVPAYREASRIPEFQPIDLLKPT